MADDKAERILLEIANLEKRVVERVGAVEKTVAEHTDAIRELRESSTVGRETAVSVKELTRAVSDLNNHVLTAISVNADQNRDIGELKAHAARAGEAAGTIAGNTAAVDVVKRYGWRGGLAVLALSTMTIWVPLLTKACNEAPYDPKTEQEPQTE